MAETKLGLCLSLSDHHLPFSSSEEVEEEEEEEQQQVEEDNISRVVGLVDIVGGLSSKRIEQTRRRKMSASIELVEEMMMLHSPLHELYGLINHKNNGLANVNHHEEDYDNNDDNDDNRNDDNDDDDGDGGGDDESVTEPSLLYSTIKKEKEKKLKKKMKKKKSNRGIQDNKEKEKEKEKEKQEEESMMMMMMGLEDSGSQAKAEEGHGKVVITEQHIRTERERRKRMRSMYNTLQRMLQLSPKADKSTIVEIAAQVIHEKKTQVEALERQWVERTMEHGILHGRGRKRVHNENTNMKPSPIISKGKKHDENQQQSYKDHSNNQHCHHEKYQQKLPNLVCEDDNLATQLVDTNTRMSVFETNSNMFLNVCGCNGFFQVCKDQGGSMSLYRLFLSLERHNVEVVSAHIFSINNQNIYSIHAQAHPDNLKLALRDLGYCLSSISTSSSS